MKTINWNQLSELGLMERINREILHPLGLAVCRNPETGVSEGALVADDGVWEYAPDMKTTVKPDDEVKAMMADITARAGAHFDDIARRADEITKDAQEQAGRIRRTSALLRRANQLVKDSEDLAMRIRHRNAVTIDQK